MIKVVYAGYDFFSGCLGALLDDDDADVVFCMTGTRDEPIGEILRLASKSAVPVHFGKPTTAVVEMVNGLHADLLVSAAYSHRLPVDQLRVRQAVNVHSTLLPFGRGPNPLPYLVDGQQQFSGVTVHQMDLEFDHGPVLLQRKVEVFGEEGFDELSLRMFAAASTAVGDLIREFPVPARQPSGGERGSYWPLQPIEDRSFRAAAVAVEQVRRLARKFGLSGVIAEFPDGSRFSSGHVSVAECSHEYPPGAVLSRASSGWIVAVVDGLVRLGDPSRL